MVSIIKPMCHIISSFHKFGNSTVYQPFTVTAKAQVRTKSVFTDIFICCVFQVANIFIIEDISVLKEINYTILRGSLGITDTHTYIPP